MGGNNTMVSITGDGYHCRLSWRLATTTSEWKNIPWYIHTMQYCSAINRNELQIHTTMWMSFKNTEQENPDIEKCILCDSTFMLNSRKDYLNLWPQKADETTNQNSFHFFPTQLTWGACIRKGTSYVLFCSSCFFCLWCWGPLILLQYSNAASPPTPPTLTPWGQSRTKRHKPDCFL